MAIKGNLPYRMADNDITLGSILYVLPGDPTKHNRGINLRSGKIGEGVLTQDKVAEASIN
jgi:hypothetical protein